MQQQQQIRTVALGHIWSIHFPSGVDVWETYAPRLVVGAGGSDDKILMTCMDIEGELNHPLFWRRDPMIERTTSQLVDEYKKRLKIRRKNLQEGSRSRRLYPEHRKKFRVKRRLRCFVQKTR